MIPEISISLVYKTKEKRQIMCNLLTAVSLVSDINIFAVPKTKARNIQLGYVHFFNLQVKYRAFKSHRCEIVSSMKQFTSLLHEVLTSLKRSVSEG